MKALVQLLLSVMVGRAYVEYRDEAGEWSETVVPRLQATRSKRGWRYLVEASGLSEREVRAVLNDGVVPRAAIRVRVRGIALTETGD